MQTYKTQELANDTLNDQLLNPWGNVVDCETVFTANTGTGTISEYKGSTLIQNILVGNGTPITGIAINKCCSWNIANGVLSGPSYLLTASLNGQVWGYNSKVSSDAILVIDNSAILDPPMYTGIAVLGKILYLTDFKHGRVEVYEWTCYGPKLVSNNKFVDPCLPTTTTGNSYSPFNIYRFEYEVRKETHELLFVSYAVKDPITNEPVFGEGFGLINVFSTCGKFISRFADNAPLNAPWGMTIESQRCGCFVLAVGNHGSGSIIFYDFSIKGKCRKPCFDVDCPQQAILCSGIPLIIPDILGLTYNKHNLVYTSETGITGGELGSYGLICKDKVIKNCHRRCKC